MTDFERLKEICRQASHQRNACKSGFEALLQAENVAELLAVWKKNWDDIYGSKFADVMADEITSVYKSLKEDFNNNGFYVNEDSDKGIVIISRPDKIISVGGNAKAYVFAKAEVAAGENAQVYNRDDASVIRLSGHAYANVKAGTVELRNFSEATGKGVFNTYQAAELTAYDSIVIDNGHRRIAAYGKSEVYSDSIRNIVLGGTSVQLPKSEYKNQQEK